MLERPEETLPDPSPCPANMAVTTQVVAHARRVMVKRQSFLSGPILPVIVSIAIPTSVVMAVQSLIGFAENYFISALGTEALAGAALVLPVVMVTLSMANGICGGVSSAISRALGAGDREEADGLLANAFFIAIAFGLLCTVLHVAFARSAYAAMGGRDAALAAALSYGNAVFLWAPFFWLVAVLSAALRGSGNSLTPSLITLVTAVTLVPLSPSLIIGWGPFPRLGIAGAGLVTGVCNLVATVGLLAYLLSGRGVLRLAFGGPVLRWSRMAAILKVGAPSAFGSVLASMSMVMITGAVGSFGTKCLAGYGIAARLDMSLIPITAGIGTAVLALVGLNIGAGQLARAYKIAWLGAAVGFVVTEAVGLLVSVRPQLWLALFTGDDEVIAAGAAYLRVVAPVYGLYGFGSAIYFASQGAGRVGWVVAGVVARLSLLVLGGWLAVTRFRFDLQDLYLLVTGSFLLMGTIYAVLMKNGLLGAIEPHCPPAEEALEALPSS